MSVWNLDSLYLSEDSIELSNDFKMTEDLILELDSLSTKLSNNNINKDIESIINISSKFRIVTYKVSCYLSLRCMTDTTNNKLTSLMNQYEMICSRASKSSALIDKWISDLNFNDIDFNNTYIKEHEYYLKEIKDSGKYLLNAAVEDVISKMKINASSNWSTLQEYLTSTLEVDYNEETITLPMVRNLAYSHDSTIRKEAYDAEIKAYNKIKDPIAFSLNSIKGEALTMSRLRGYDSVIDMTLNASRLNKKTLDAMMLSMEKSLPHFRRYLKQKANILGYKNGLPFYELFAPIGNSNKTFTIDEAKNYLIDTFNSENEDIAQLISRSFNDEWIDFYPRKGKVGGASCTNLPMIKESRICTNFEGSLSDVVTLAHELGHAYHGYCIEDNSILNTDYTMPVAETASIFNETIIMNRVIKDATSDQEKLMLLESSLQDSTQVIVDIMSRYIFESSVIEAKDNEFMLADRLCELMIDAQDKTYGDALDPNYKHPYMWVNKGHYYSAGLNFYNFPYAFGLLFAKGIYAQYQDIGKPFFTTYKELLNKTGVMSCEDVAKIANIDITDPKFWDSSLRIIINQIDEFIELSNKIYNI